MTLDIGEVLSRAWHITWNYKILWVFGLLGMILAFLFFPLGFAPMFSILMAEDIPVWIEQPVFMFGYFGVFILLMIGSLFLGAIMQAAISLGAWRAENGSDKLFFRETLKDSTSYFWRFLGIIAMLMGGVLLVTVGFFVLQMVVSVVTFGLGTMCLIPLQFLIYPLMFIAYAWQEQALASIIVDDFSVMEAARQGWQVCKKNLLPVALITLILYLGIGMMGGFVAIPMMAPFFLIPFALLDEMQNLNTILIIASLCMVAYMPILAVFQSGALTFMKSGWILTYLRLTRDSDKEQPVALPAE